MAVNSVSSVVNFLRRKWLCSCPVIGIHIRLLRGECEVSKESELGAADDVVESEFTNVARAAVGLCQSNPKWDDVLLSRYGSFNFNDPRFFFEFLKHENNVFSSMTVFQWLWSRYKFVPDEASCSKLLASLCDAKAHDIAKQFLCTTGYRPNADTLENLVRCLCRDGLIEDAMNVFFMFKEVDACPPVATWNLMFAWCEKSKRTNLTWKLYQHMIDSDALGLIDAKTVKHIIFALCRDGQEEHGYHLFKLALEKELIPYKVTCDDLINVFARKGALSTASEILHLMIERNIAPDLYAYQPIILSLWKGKRASEALRIFNEVRNRGYEINDVVYSTMIRGLGGVGQLEEARKLWLEMKDKGLEPSGYTYSSLAFGYFINRDWKMGMQLFIEMRDRGLGENTICYNMAINGLCWCSQAYKALQLLKEMKEKGISRSIKSYNPLISSFARSRKVTTSKVLLKELVAEGIKPTVPSYRAIIHSLCLKGKVKMCKKMWDEMLKCGLEPMVFDYDVYISALARKNQASEAMKCFTAMLDTDFKPRKITLVRLLLCLLKNNRMNEAFSLLNFMYKIDYTLGEGMASYLTKKCKNSRSFIQRCSHLSYKDYIIRKMNC